MAFSPQMAIFPALRPSETKAIDSQGKLRRNIFRGFRHLSASIGSTEEIMVAGISLSARFCICNAPQRNTVNQNALGVSGEQRLSITPGSPCASSAQQLSFQSHRCCPSRWQSLEFSRTSQTTRARKCHQRAVPASHFRSRHHLFNEPVGQRLR